MYSNRADVLEEERIRIEERRQASNRKSNLDRILNYEKYLNANSDTVSECVEEKTSQSINDYNQIDITPSSTTMQFSSKEGTDIFEEINRKTEIKEKTAVSYSVKSKIAAIIFACALVAVFTLVIVNASRLKSLDNIIDNYNARIAELTEENAKINAQLEYVRSDEVIAQKAEEMGMVRE